MKVFGYARSTSDEQAIKSQINILKSNNIEKIYVDNCINTGTSSIGMSLLLKDLKCNDQLVITSIDRLTSDAKKAIIIIKELYNKSIILKILNLGNVGVINNEENLSLIINILRSFNDMQKDSIIERTQRGKKYAKINNPKFHEGRPKRNKKGSINGIPYLEIFNYSNNHTIKDTAIYFGISKRSINNIKNVFKNK